MKTQWLAALPRALKECGLLSLVALFFLTSCVVTSIYPYYHAKDLTFDPALLGVWQDAKEDGGDKETWTFEKLDDRTYKLITADGEKKNEFDAHLFQLKGALFLDLLSRERPDNAAPLHFLMRVDAVAPNLQMRLLKYDWLAKLVEQNPKVIRHTIVPKKGGDGEGGDLVLTADTAEPQKFTVKHLKTADAWSDPVKLKKR